jgi:uncharacterized protein YraI
VLLFVARAPAGVAAVTATLTAGLHLRAGPDIVYPSVMMLPPGAVVQVFGCEQAVTAPAEACARLSGALSRGSRAPAADP